MSHFTIAKYIYRQKICIAKDISIAQAPLSVGFSRQEYWSVLPSSSPEDLPKYIVYRITQKDYKNVYNRHLLNCKSY